MSTKHSREKLVGEKIDESDDFDLAMILILVEAGQSELDHTDELNAKLIALLRREQENRKHQKKKSKKNNDIDVENSFDDEPPKFSSWSEVRNETSNALFRKKF